MTVAALMVFAAPAVLAAGGAKLDGKKLYTEKTCVACHGPEGKKPLLPEYPRIAGQSVAYMIRQMTDIKSGARANGNSNAMNGVMGLVNEDEIKALAEYLGSVKP
jgi:cytochrome c